MKRTLIIFENLKVLYLFKKWSFWKIFGVFKKRKTNNNNNELNQSEQVYQQTFCKPILEIFQSHKGKHVVKLALKIQDIELKL